MDILHHSMLHDTVAFHRCDTLNDTTALHTFDMMLSDTVALHADLTC